MMDSIKFYCQLALNEIYDIDSGFVVFMFVVVMQLIFIVPLFVL